MPLELLLLPLSLQKQNYYTCPQRILLPRSLNCVGLHQTHKGSTVNENHGWPAVYLNRSNFSKLLKSRSTLSAPPVSFAAKSMVMVVARQLPGKWHSAEVKLLEN